MPLNIFELGNRIRDCRKQKLMTQETLAERIDRTPTYLSYVENGSKCLSLETFIDVANALDVTADDLLQDSLESTAVIMEHELSEILSDCSLYELRVIRDIALAAKTSLRDYKNYILVRSRK